jgi:hypothetical protein
MYISYGYNAIPSFEGSYSRVNSRESKPGLMNKARSSGTNFIRRHLNTTSIPFTTRC